MTAITNRVLHITLEKCGSQWVRDVLSAPEIVACSGRPHSGISLNINACNQLEIADQTFSGPIYGMNQWKWQYWKRPGDKAVVVLRDPRDVMISLMFSWLYSHGSDDRVDAGRRLLHEMLNDEKRVAYMIAGSGIGARRRMYRTWADGTHDDALVVRYELLVSNQHAEFRKIVDWLGWNVPKETLDAVVERLSFQSRSGHKPGFTDKFSHYRRGVSGDWRNYFTRQHGERWERLYPGFLREIGYETGDDWWSALPEKLAADVPTEQGGMAKPDAEAGLVEALQARERQLQQELVEKERVIQQLLLGRGEPPAPHDIRALIAGVHSRLKGR